MFRIFWRFLFPHHTEHYVTVRYAFPFLLVTVLFAGLASVISEQSSYITITTDRTTLLPDQQFFIDIQVTAHVPVNALDVVISYPKEKINIESIDTGTSVITLWTEEPYAKDGNIYLRGGTFRKGFIGEHKIARIRAAAIESGNARIFLKSTQLLAGDGQGSVIPVTESAIQNQVQIFVSEDTGIISGGASISIITDTDGDGDVDLADISAFMAAWFTKSKTFDFNGDGRMTFRDFSILLADSFFR